MRRGLKKAFTLVEILIVVVILGILAAIVIPQFTSASDEAMGSNVSSQLSTIRQQLELFRVRNNGQDPDFDANGWGDPAGADDMEIGLRGDDYLRDDPINPRTGTATIAESATGEADAQDPAVQGGTAWYFDTVSRDIFAAGWDEDNNVWFE